MAAPTTWSEDRRRVALDLWADGWSGRDIATKLGGVSRNAVIGMIFRAKGGRSVPPRKRILRVGDNQRRPKNRRERMRTVAAYREAERLGEARHQAHAGPDLDVPEAERVSLLDLEPQHCRWPYGDGPFTFCGKNKVSGKSYCEFHTLRALPAPQAYATGRARTPGSGNADWRAAVAPVKDPIGALYPVDLQTLEILEKEPA